MASGLIFDDDVVRERCFQADPFDSQFMASLNQLRRVPVKRLRNDISYLNRPVDPQTYLKPVKPAKSISCVKSRPSVTPDLETTHGRSSQPADLSKRGSQEISLSWMKSASNNDIPPDKEWDECLLLKLNANTARWLAESPLTTEDDRKRLHGILDAVHGPTNIESQMQLVEYDHGETAEADAVKEVKKPFLSEKDM